MESHSDIAESAVQCLDEGYIDSFMRLVVDLEQAVGGRGVRKHLARAGIAGVYLKKASESAAEGDKQASERYLGLARRYVDENEIAALTEENRFNYSVVPEPAVAQTRHVFGFVS